MPQPASCAACCERATVATGTALSGPADDGDAMYLIEAAAFGLPSLTTTKTKLSWLSWPEAIFFGEMAIIDGKKRSA